VDAGGAFGKTREPFYLAMNPNSRVPTIEEPDGYTLWESHSILRYLVASRAPGHAVHPTEPRARGDVERWMDWLLATLNPPMTVLFWTFVRTPRRSATTPRPPVRATRLKGTGPSSTGNWKGGTTWRAASRWPTSA
jgi:glutathione S-transferase